MNSTRITTPGVSSVIASTFSLSSSRVMPETRMRSAGRAAPAAPPATTTTGSFKACRSSVDLAQLPGCPLARLLGLHLAAARLGVHHGDDVLVPGFGRLLVGLAGKAHQPG